MLSLFLFCIFFFLTHDLLSKGFFNDERELSALKDNSPHHGHTTQPPDLSPRAPAEFEETGGLIITWAGFEEELREIVRYSAGGGLSIYILTDDPVEVQDYLIKGGVFLENVSFVQIPFNSAWIRDYGPKSIYLDGSDDLAFIDWVYNHPRPLDNSVPENVADYLNLPVYQITSGQERLVHVGGNLMVDGHGTAFSSELILAENGTLTENQIDNAMYDYLGVDRYIKTEMLPDDKLHHIDMYMKLLDEETLLVGEFPEGVPARSYIEANLQYILDNYESCHGRPYNVVRIPMSPCPQGKYPPNADLRTYTNSLILNNMVLVPQFHDASLNAEALAVYEDAMPGYQVIGINMEGMAHSSGAIHCLSRGIAANDPVFISHAPIRNANPDETITVEAEISNADGINNAVLYWRTDRKSFFQQKEMSLQGGVYKAGISGQPPHTEIYYYISATNNNKKTITKPFTAPAGTYTFSVGDKTPVEQPEETVAFNAYPNPSEGNFNLILPRVNETIDIVIADMHGKPVYENSIESNEFDYSYPVSLENVSPGIYLIRITWQQNSETERIVII